jgi:ech hydrogenase subunit A
MPKESLLGFLILFPFVAATIAWILPTHKARTPWVWATAIIMIVASLLLITKGAVPVELKNAEAISKLIGFLDLALLVYFFVVGIQAKSWPISIFAAVQVVPFVWIEWLTKSHPAVTATFIADWLSIVMVLVISIVGSVICVYATKYMEDHEQHLHLGKSRTGKFMFMMIFFLGAMNALVLCNNLLWVYFFWEVTTFICFQLILHDLSPIAITNARRALWMNLIGGIAFVFALYVAIEGFHTLSMDDLVRHHGSQIGILLPVVLLCFAGFTKAAQPPFHGWLLGAMVAPTPVSALLHSSTMVKAGVYLVLRMAPAFQHTHFSLIVAVFGGFTLLITAIMALSQSNAKKVLAYSTIGNLGLIILCAGINTPLAIAAAIILIIFHAVSKAILFMTVGAIEGQIGSRDIEDMEGLCCVAPALTGVLVVGVLSMLAPPFGVLVGKWAIMEAVPTIEASANMLSRWSFVVVLLLALGSAVTVVFWTKWLARVLSSLPETETCPPQKLPAAYGFSLWGLVGLVIALSIFAAPLVGGVVLPSVQSWYNPIVDIIPTAGMSLDFGTGFIPIIFLVIVGVLFLYLPQMIIKVRKQSVRPVYLCGENIENQSKWHGLADMEFGLVTGGFYFENNIAEERMNIWAIALSAGALVFALALGLLAMWPPM